MKLIDGKKLANIIKEELKKEISVLKEKKIIPTLAIILVGYDPASEIYVKNKIKTCDEIGIDTLLYRFTEENSESQIIAQIKDLNADDRVDGILIQSPLPVSFNENKIISYVDPKKDVDGFGINNLGALLSNDEAIVAATPLGILKMLDSESVSLEGKHVVMVGASRIVGRPMAIALLNRGCTVTICHKKTKNLKEITSQADILIVAIGQAKFISSDFIKDGAVVIDVGINRIDNHLYGDVDFDSVSIKASLITPVPGGVGPMTIVMLLSNVIDVAKRRIKNGSKN